jgi:hypothetical protein
MSLEIVNNSISSAYRSNKLHKMRFWTANYVYSSYHFESLEIVRSHISTYDSTKSTINKNNEIFREFHQVLL